MDVINDTEYFLQAMQRDNQLLQRMQQKALEYTKIKKNGRYCVADCGADPDDCPVCLECQKVFETKLKEFEAYELQMSRIKNEPEKKEVQTKCSLCGAPVENGQSECPYCGTAYNSIGDGFSSVDTTKSMDEWLQDMIISTLLTKIAIMQNEYNGVLDILVEMTQESFLAQMQARNLMAQGCLMTPHEAIEDAKRYGISCAEYFSKLLLGEIQSSRYMKSVEIEQKNAQIQREANQKIHDIQMSDMQRNAEIRLRNTPNYVGGSSGGAGNKCCGNCSNYMPGEARCAMNPNSSYQVNATEFCASYRSL